MAPKTVFSEPFEYNQYQFQGSMMPPIQSNSVPNTSAALVQFKVEGVTTKHVGQRPEYFTVHIFQDRNSAQQFLTTKNQANNLSTGAITIKGPAYKGNEIGEIVFFNNTIDMVTVVHELLHAALEYERRVYSNPSCQITPSHLPNGNEEVFVSTHTNMLIYFLLKIKKHAQSGLVSYPKNP